MGTHITVRNHDNTEDIPLPHLDHFTDPAEAAHALWEAVSEAAKKHGGVARLHSPETRGRDGWAVEWNYGPEQWSEAYVVCEEVHSSTFVCEAVDETTVAIRCTLRE